MRSLYCLTWGAILKRVQDDCRGLGLREGGMVEGREPQGMVEDVGGRARAAIRSACARKVVAEVRARRRSTFTALISFSTMAPGAGESLIQHRWGGGVQRRHDKAWGIAGTHDFGLEHHAPRLCPRLVRQRCTPHRANNWQRRLAMGLGQRDLLVMETTRCLDGGSGLAEQDGMAHKKQDKIQVQASRDDHVDDLWGGARTIATNQEMGVWGQGRRREDNSRTRDHGIFGASRARARTQGGRDQSMGCPLENAERQIVMVLIVMIIARQLLLAIGRVIGVSEVEHNSGWGLCVTGHKVVHEGPHEPREVLPVDVVLQTRDGRGTGSSVARIREGGRSPPRLNTGSRRRLLASLAPSTA